MTIQAITFDFFGTLAHHGYGTGRKQRFGEYLETHGLVGRSDGPLLHPAFDTVQGRWGTEPAESTWIAFTKALFEIASVQGAASVDDHANGIAEVFGPASFRVYEDVRPVLDSLQQRNVRLAVISNWPRGLDYFLHELGLLPGFELVVCSAEVGVEKPDAHIFGVAAEGLGLKPQDILHVGDEREADFEGARRAGFRSVWLTRGGDRAKHSITTLDRVLELA